MGGDLFSALFVKNYKEYSMIIGGKLQVVLDSSKAYSIGDVVAILVATISFL